MREVADAELGDWTYVKTPTYDWVDIGGSKAIRIRYTRTGVKGTVACTIYIFPNYDEMAKIVTAYRVNDESMWKTAVDNAVSTFKWKQPK